MPIANINWNGQTYRIDFDRKLTDNEVFDYMQKNFPKQETKQEIVEETPKEKLDVKTFAKEYLKPKAEKILNIGRSIGQGATFGQGSHLAGLGEGVGSMAYDVVNPIRKSIDNLSRLKNPLTPLKDIKKAVSDDYTKDYTEGREEFKKEYKDFEDKNKALALGGEIIGGLGTGLSSGALKGIMASKPLLKGALAGAGLGGAYGLSNTEGKGVDVKSGLVGAGLGGVLGGLIPLGAEKVLKPAINKISSGVGTLGKLYNKGFDTSAKALNPVKEVIDEEGKKLTGTVSSYARPAGTQNRTARLFAENPKIREEALKGDVGLRFEEYGNNAVKSMSKIKEVAKQAENNAYKQAGITDDYLIDLSKSNIVKDLENITKNYNDEIALFANSTKANTNLGNDLLTDLRIATAVNGNKLTFGNLKRITKKLYNDKQKAYKDFGGGSSEYKLLSDYYKAFADLKYKDTKLAKANAKYAELEKAIENLEETTGINLDKPKQFAAKIFSGARDRADGGIQEKALEDFTRVVDKFADTKELKAIADNIKMAQFAYDLRPTSIDSKFARDVAQGVGRGDTLVGLGKNVLKKAVFGRDINPQEFYQLLARRIKAGKVRPEDLTKQFNRIKVAGLDDITANRLYLQNKLLGNRAGTIGKIIEQFYK